MRIPGAEGMGDVVAQPTNLRSTINPGAYGQQIGHAITDAAAHVAEQDDTQAVFEARRKLDDWERSTIYDPQAGAVSKLGKDAFDLPKTLPGEFDKASSEIGGGLKSTRAKMAFQQMAASRREQVGAWADRHALQQKGVYEHGQFEADITASTSRTALLTNTGQMDAAKGEIAMMQARTIGFFRGKGRSEEEIAQKVRDYTSKAHILAVEQLLDADRALDADKYLKENARGMRDEDLLRARSHVDKQVDAHTALVTAADVVRSLKPRVMPGNMDRLTELVKSAESGGRRYGPDGVTLLTSPKGAKGEMQVMDGTNKSPGFGVKPAANDSPDERARVGRDYLAAMIKEFGGNVSQALAAYNAGPAEVKKAIKAADEQRSGTAGPDWLEYLPQETQAYVAKVGKAYGEGQGVPSMPTLEDVHAGIRARVGIDRPHRLQVALAEGTRQFEDMLKAKKGREDDAEAAAMDWLSKNGGRFSQLPAQLRSALPPKSVDNVLTYGQKIAKGDDITDPLVFQKMATDDGYLKGLTDAQFYTQSRRLSQADGERMAIRRGELLTGMKGRGANDLDTGAVNTIVNNRLQQMGTDPTPKDGGADAQRVGAIRKFVWDSVMGAQLAAGKKFGDAEISGHVDQLFTKSVTFQTTFLGFSTGASSQRLMGMKLGDIPSDIRTRLKADFKKQGIEPTDADLLGAYLHLNMVQPRAQPRGTTGDW